MCKYISFLIKFMGAFLLFTSLGFLAHAESAEPDTKSKVETVETKSATEINETTSDLNTEEMYNSDQVKDIPDLPQNDDN